MTLNIQEPDMDHPTEAQGHTDLLSFAERIAINAEHMASDPEQTATSRRWWKVCADDARDTLARATQPVQP